MGMDPISVGYLALSGFGAYQQYQAGQEAEAAYKQQAAEIKRQTAYQQRMTLEGMKDLDREGRAAVGQAKAAAGKSGVRVGGSVSTLTGAIRAKVERRKALTAMEFNEGARRNQFTASNYRRMGQSVSNAGKINAFGSLLTGGLRLAKRKEELGPKTTLGGLFFTDRRST